VNPSSFSVAIPGHVHETALAHLIRPDGQEDLCFALWYPSQGHSRQTALIHRILMPMPGERRVHGNASFEPRYFERSVVEAVRSGAGVAFMHSHPGPGWQDMSRDDIDAEHGNAGACKGATGLPLVGLTVGSDGAWSARFWEKAGPAQYMRRWCSTVRAAGSQLQITYNDRLIPPPRSGLNLRRTLSAWGATNQAHLARMRIGVVGAGSVGSIVAEVLARTGFRQIVLVDFDSVEELNLDRLLHAYLRDVVMARSKVTVLGRAIKRSATAEGFDVDMVESSIVEELGFRKALDCDVIFSCVDRPWARSVLNYIAYGHLIPVVDGGILVTASKSKGLIAADWRAHIGGPGRRCLECLGQYDPGLVSTERDGYFDDPHYIEGLPDDHFIKRNENVFAFSASVASFEILQLLMMILAPLGVSNAGAQMYHFVPGLFDRPSFDPCNANCPFSTSLLARGDRSGMTLGGLHAAADKARLDRSRRRATIPWRLRLLDWLQRGIEQLASRYDHRVDRI
jgi:molybdopterin/thiamine biosynthesis adenylyltransferase